MQWCGSAFRGLVRAERNSILAYFGGRIKGMDTQVPKPRYPKPETQNPRPDARNPKPGNPNLLPETRNLKPETRNFKPET